MIRIEFEEKTNKAIAYDEEKVIGLCEYIITENIIQMKIHTFIEIMSRSKIFEEWSIKDLTPSPKTSTLNLQLIEEDVIITN